MGNLLGFDQNLPPIYVDECQDMKIIYLVTFYQGMATSQVLNCQVKMQIAKFMQNNFMYFYLIP
jgi:hypothetical protein